jgi:ABC-type transporter Mla subunit MlaD
MDAGGLMQIAIGIFFVLVGLGLGYACLRMAGLFAQLTTMVGDVDREVVPILNRLQTTVDEVNSELGKIDEITGSVVNVTGTLEQTTTAVHSAIGAPIRAAASASAGVSQAFSTFLGGRRKES